MTELVSDPRMVAELVRGPYPRPILMPNPFSPEIFHTLIAGFEEVLADTQREQWMLDPKTHNNGLIRRDPTKEDPYIDPKWMWHYSLHEFWNVAHKAGLDTSRHACFLQLCHETILTGIKTVLPIIHELDTQLSGYAFERNFLAADCFLRLIKDDPPLILGRHEVATPHEDFSFCTFHWYETRPHLLWFNEQTEAWVPVDFDDMRNQPVVFFLGRKAALMTGGKREIEPDGTQSKRVVRSSGILRPVNHRVIEVGPLEELTTSRYAAVLFFHTPLVP